MLRTYMVLIADRETGQDQRILVQSKHPEGMQEFVERTDLNPPLQITNPVVIGVTELTLRSRLPKTTMAQFTA